MNIRKSGTNRKLEQLKSQYDQKAWLPEQMTLLTAEVHFPEMYPVDGANLIF